MTYENEDNASSKEIDATVENYFSGMEPHPNDGELQPGDRIHRGQFLYMRAWGAKMNLQIQEDGNLVFWSNFKNQSSSHPFWTARSNGKNPVYVVMQEDGNLVLRRGNGDVLWSSGTHGHPGTMLRMGQSTTTIDGRAHYHIASFELFYRGDVIWNSLMAPGTLIDRETRERYRQHDPDG